MLYTVLAAMAPRKPENWGVQLKPVKECPWIISRQVMLALIQLERAYPGAGQAMRDGFFPGTMSPDEKAFWDKAETYLEGMNRNKGGHAVNNEAAAARRILEGKFGADVMIMVINSSADWE